MWKRNQKEPLRNQKEPVYVKLWALITTIHQMNINSKAKTPGSMKASQIL
jgi:hypothetical protein